MAVENGTIKRMFLLCWVNCSWQKEYKRFRKVFRQTTASPYIASLPGNHDIGVSDTVSPIALSRFKKHFGEPSSEFKAGDFTIILLDTVSLSAVTQYSISRHPQEFLESLRSTEPTEPRILLTHIPLFRPEGTSCGPLRESKTGIHLGKGYQYQNVLTPELSKKVVDIIRPLAVFSGDDHDYCFVQHNYGGMKIPEHTVRSFSWAMVCMSQAKSNIRE
jgi:ethanolamine phosphate phosphodiesterase